jgi:hypothetical protein
MKPQSVAPLSIVTLTSLFLISLVYALDMPISTTARLPDPLPNYIYRAPQVPLDTERYPVAPASLSLEQVQVFVRHGMQMHLYHVYS